MNEALTTLKDIETAFPTQHACMAYLERLVWKDGIISPFNPESEVRREFDYHYYCKASRQRFSVLTHTIFSSTKLPLQSWFKVIWLYQVSPGLSTVKVAELTGVKQKTVWSIKKRIDKALLSEKLI